MRKRLIESKIALRKLKQYIGKHRGGGDSTFSSRSVRPGFPKCGACDLILTPPPSCELKFSNLEA